MSAEASSHAASGAGAHPAPYRSSKLPDVKLLMWVFLASDTMFFGSLIGTYLAYRERSLVGPFPRDLFDIPLTTVSTFVLLMSSFLMVLSLHALRQNDIGKFRLWTAGVAFFGAIFLGFQVFEFTHFAHAGLSIHQNLFGTTFFISTSFRVFDDPNLHGGATQREASDRNRSGTRAANRQTERFNVRRR